MAELIDNLLSLQRIDAGGLPIQLERLDLASVAAEVMDAYEVSRLVNDPRNDSPACIMPARLADSIAWRTQAEMSQDSPGSPEN